MPVDRGVLSNTYVSAKTAESIATTLYLMFLNAMLAGQVISWIYEKTHWTKADYAMVEGQFTDAINYVENSQIKDEYTKNILYNKIYKYATNEAGIEDPDHPILKRLYSHGVERKDPVMFFDKRKGPRRGLWGHRGKWTPTFPVWKKKMAFTRRSSRKSNRQTRKA